MKNVTQEFKILFIIITSLALSVLVYTLYTTTWTFSQIINIIVFSILVVASESMPVPLPKGGFVTVSYAIFICSVVLFPLGVALIIAAVAGIVMFGETARKQPLYKRVFNSSHYILSLTVTSSLITLFGLSLDKLTSLSFALYLVAALAYIVINITTVALALGALNKVSAWEIWVGSIRWSFLNFVALAPLGFLMAMIYKTAGAFGLVLFVIPLLLSRRSFQRYMDMRGNYVNTIKALVRAIEAKDTYTRGHSERVAQYSVAIAEKLKLPQDRIEYILYGAILHDVGKIGVSESILNKKDKLLDSELESIRNHPVIGQQLVKDIKFLYDIDLGVRHHHEHFDGTGYPDRIKGMDIPLEARIIAVADCFDAMTSTRTYRGARTTQEALVEMKRVAGSQLDPELVEVFCHIYHTVEVDESSFLFGELIEQPAS
jgi:HD-GYP domain-containing protein (c-di-GMP phosphodiesterase class II)